jgi:hydroxymethylpyrimidine/phosphomethylpyrimidine kinase
MGGLDPSGGAGVLRDAVVAAGLGVHPMAVPLAETVQSGMGCEAILPPAVPPAARLASIAPHLRGAWGVKVSMFSGCGALREVAPMLRALGPAAAIWDPVAAPSSGVPLHGPESLREAAGLLSGGGWVASPNLGEARLMAGMPGAPLEDVAERLLRMGFLGAWIRTGHGVGGTVRDLWCDGGGPRWLAPRPRLAGDPRGTGCTATAAWLALRLKGAGPAEAAEGAVDYIRRAWAGLHSPGGAGRPTFPPAPLTTPATPATPGAP